MHLTSWKGEVVYCIRSCEERDLIGGMIGQRMRLMEEGDEEGVIGFNEMKIIPGRHTGPGVPFLPAT